jgi:hypothetical protein
MVGFGVDLIWLRLPIFLQFLIWLQLFIILRFPIKKPIKPFGKDFSFD